MKLKSSYNLQNIKNNLLIETLGSLDGPLGSEFTFFAFRIVLGMTALNENPNDDNENARKSKIVINLSVRIIDKL